MRAWIYTLLAIAVVVFAAVVVLNLAPDAPNPLTASHGVYVCSDTSHRYYHRSDTCRLLQDCHGVKTEVDNDEAALALKLNACPNCYCADPAVWNAADVA